MQTITLTIDGRVTQVAEGTTILEAARGLGIEIPTMCHREGCTPSTSCMVCVVRVNGSPNLVPACAMAAVEGMRVESDTAEVHLARRTALELLLSDHAGDCVGPCVNGCPASMDIPLMIRQIAAGRMEEAIATVKQDIALPAVLGRICPAPCERVCRRSYHDGGVGICLLKRYAADVDLATGKPYVPQAGERKGKRVAVVGAGPAGLAAAYYLGRLGYECTLYDDHDKPGGQIRYSAIREKVPQEVLTGEIDSLLAVGVAFKARTRVGADVNWDQIREWFDAVFVATGEMTADEAQGIGLAYEKDRLRVEKGTYRTSIDGVFAGGNVAGPKRHLAVRSCADGKEAAAAIHQYLSGRAVVGPEAPFNIRIGKPREEEMPAFLKLASPSGRVENVDADRGLTPEQARTEALRCLHCDCRKADGCKLRIYSHRYGASPTAYKSPRRAFEQQVQHEEIIYESGKCIDCGLCIQIARQHGEKLGLSFVQRGFDVRVAVPFDRSIAEGLRFCARACAEACPTGAIALKNR